MFTDHYLKELSNHKFGLAQSGKKRGSDHKIINTIKISRPINPLFDSGTSVEN